jgi:hypothetical protein
VEKTKTQPSHLLRKEGSGHTKHERSQHSGCFSIINSINPATEMSDKKDKKEKRGFFGAKKSVDASVRKSKSFKRIRGLLNGSKSKKTLEKEEKQRDEAETVYDVDVEDRSIMTRQTVEEAKPFLLKIVLLLMDPVTRRFELLQLEFDSLNATVNDILVQIPVSVTEEALRKQKYVAICGPDAKEKSSTDMLSNFCVGNGVLVAIPDGLQSRECVRLATPILSDTKVTQMVSKHLGPFHD